MTATTAVATGGPRARTVTRLIQAGREQAVVTTGLAVAGFGNLLFVAMAARILDHREFGWLAAFVALHTALHLPGVGLAAAGALDPTRAAGLTRRCAIAGVVIGGVLALGAVPIGSVLGLPTTLVLALAASAPAALLLGLRRGVAYGERNHGAIVRSLLAEPAVRCTLGLGLAAYAGAGGAVWGVVVGGWLGLAMLRGSRSEGDAAVTVTVRTGAAATALSFVVLTLLQHQDLVVANRLLDGIDVGTFAAVSTIGGLVAFASATLPLVLLAPPREGEPPRLAVAVAGAVVIGGIAMLAAALVPDAMVTTIVGPDYLAARSYLVPYLGAMAALGLARVLAAHRCATGGARRTAVIVSVVAVGHLTALLLFGRTPGAFVSVTAASLGVATLGLAVPPRRPAPAHRRRRPPRLQRLRDCDAPLLTLLVAVAVLVRLATNRSLWIDEAISVGQARMPFGAMLQDLRDTDVHPPLHHIILWLTSRVAGTSEAAVRLPSIVAGAATIPAIYGLARELFDKRTARVAALIAVPAPFLVWYSQEARMYALFMLAGVLALWAQVAAMHRGRPIAFVAWAFASAAMVWTQWFGLLPVAVQFAAGGLAILKTRRGPKRRRLLIGVGSTVLLLAVLLAPLVPLMLDQLARYADSGAGLSTTPSAVGLDASDVGRDRAGVYAVIANLLWSVTGYHADNTLEQLGALWPLGMLGGLLFLGRRCTQGTKLVLGVAILPALGLLGISIFKRDLFELRYFALISPLFLVLVARGATTLASRRTAVVLAAGLLTATSVAGLVDQQLNGANPRLYDFRGAVQEITDDAGPSAAVAVEPEYLDTVVAYYGPQIATTPVEGLDASRAPATGIDVLVAERLIGSEQVSSRVGRTLYELEQRFGPPGRIERPNVIVWRFR